MATLLSSALPFAFSTIGTLARHTTLAGAGIGATAGFFGTDEGSFTQRLRGAASGALWGAAGGTAVGQIPWALKKVPSKGIVGKSIKGAWNTGKGGIKAANFALEHPLLVGGTALGAAGAISMFGKIGQGGASPTLSGSRVQTNYDEQAMRAEQLRSTYINASGFTGSAPELQQESMMFDRMYQAGAAYTNHQLRRSTFGLVEGLHASRHG